MPWIIIAAIGGAWIGFLVHGLLVNSGSADRRAEIIKLKRETLRMNLINRKQAKIIRYERERANTATANA